MYNIISSILSTGNFQITEQENIEDYYKSLNMIIGIERPKKSQKVYRINEESTHLHFSVDTRSPST